MNVNSKPLGHSQPFHSFENVLGDKDTFRALAGKNTIINNKLQIHSDGIDLDWQPVPFFFFFLKKK